MSLVVNEKPAKELEKKEVEHSISGTCDTNKDDKFGKRESKNESSAEWSTTSAEAPDWKITAASVPQNYLLARNCTLFGVNLCLNTLLADCKVL